MKNFINLDSIKKEEDNMITLLLLLTAIVAIAIVALVITGVAIVAWPLIVILGIGLFLDIFFLKLLFKKKKK